MPVDFKYCARLSGFAFCQLPEQSSSEDVSLRMPRHACKDVSVLQATARDGPGGSRTILSDTWHDAVPAQYKHLTPPWQSANGISSTAISTSHIQNGVVRIRNKVRRGARPVERRFSNKPSHQTLGSVLRISSLIPSETYAPVQELREGDLHFPGWSHGSVDWFMDYDVGFFTSFFWRHTLSFLDRHV